MNLDNARLTITFTDEELQTYFTSLHLPLYWRLVNLGITMIGALLFCIVWVGIGLLVAVELL